MKKARNQSGKKPKKIKEVKPYESKYKIDYESLTKIDKIPLTVKLSGIRSEFSTLELLIPMNYSLGKVAEIINEKNNYACKDIKLFIGDESKSLENVMNKTFLELGMFKPEPTIIYYKFSPVENPLLLAGFY